MWFNMLLNKSASHQVFVRTYSEVLRKPNRFIPPTVINTSYKLNNLTQQINEKF